MADHTIPIFKSGVQNLLPPELIASDAAQDELNWISADGKLMLAYGRNLVGNEGTVGKISGLWYGYKVDGTKILFRKIGTKIQYLNVATWTDLITGLTQDAEYSFANYSSLAGAFTFVSGVDGTWKIITANLSVIKLLDTTSPFRGRIMIDKGRMLLWNRSDNKTTLYHSHIDVQKDVAISNGGYTTVSGEAIGSSGSKNYSGTLAFKAGGATRNCFGVTFTATTGAGAETFTDDYLGNLKSNAGGTGTIDYSTGAYTIAFNATTTGSVTSTYLWENSNSFGLTDFTSSATRKAGEGNFYQQDQGGDALLNVLIGSDGNYYSLKARSSYVLNLSADDTTGTNEVYRSDLGIPNWRAAIASNKGIVFMNTANPAKPQMTILQKNLTSDNLEPVILFPHFKFANYIYDDCAFATWERYILVACKSKTATNNDTILLCDIETGIVDIIGYGARMFAKDDSGNLYAGSPVTENVYQLFNGFDDDSTTINNFYIGKADQYQMATGFARQLRYQIGERLKKFRKLKVKGLIDPAQSFEIWMSFDGAGFQLMGTISGKGSYVDYTTPQSIGKMIGLSQIGGDDAVAVGYPYFTEIPVKMPKFRTRTIKIVAKGFGYVDIQMLSDWDILIFEGRLPARFRQKSHISVDGTQTDLPNAL